MKRYVPAIHHRRSIRLQNYDYGKQGAYFFTICIYKRIEMFGQITDDGLYVNHRGEIAQDMWNSLPNRFPGTELDAFIVMPNHVHGIIVRAERITPINHPSPDQKINHLIQNSKPLIGNLEKYRISPYRYQTLSEIVRTYKALVSYHLHRRGNTPEFCWRREYYDHIIRNAQELDIIRNYILNNPLKWQQDKLHPLSKWHSKQKR